jgi:hypothetical protein
MALISNAIAMNAVNSSHAPPVILLIPFSISSLFLRILALRRGIEPLSQFCSLNKLITYDFWHLASTVENRIAAFLYVYCIAIFAALTSSSLWSIHFRCSGVSISQYWNICTFAPRAKSISVWQPRLSFQPLSCISPSQY